MDKKNIYQTPRTEIVMAASANWFLDKTFTVNTGTRVDDEATNEGSIWDDTDPIWDSK